MLVIWKDERQIGMSRGLPYSLACEWNSVLNKSLTGYLTGEADFETKVLRAARVPGRYSDTLLT